MKLYRTTEGIIIEKAGSFFPVIDEDWQTFINDDNLAIEVERLALILEATDELNSDTILPPIGDQQELWACGVTYLRSKIGRQEESKDAGGADFYGKVYDAERPAKQLRHFS